MVIDPVKDLFPDNEVRDHSSTEYIQAQIPLNLFEQKQRRIPCTHPEDQQQDGWEQSCSQE